jgi:predicted nucleotidyltransferase
MMDRIGRLKPQLRACGVKRLAVFGSFARDTQDSASDVDLLAEFEPGQKTFDNFLAVCELLEESLQRRVELLTPESLSPHLGPRILQEAEDVLVAD